MRPGEIQLIGLLPAERRGFEIHPQHVTLLVWPCVWLGTVLAWPQFWAATALLALLVALSRAGDEPATEWLRWSLPPGLLLALALPGVWAWSGARPSLGLVWALLTWGSLLPLALRRGPLQGFLSLTLEAWLGWGAGLAFLAGPSRPLTVATVLALLALPAGFSAGLPHLGLGLVLWSLGSCWPESELEIPSLERLGFALASTLWLATVACTTASWVTVVLSAVGGAALYAGYRRVDADQAEVLVSVWWLIVLGVADLLLPAVALARCLGSPLPLSVVMLWCQAAALVGITVGLASGSALPALLAAVLLHRLTGLDPLPLASIGVYLSYWALRFPITRTGSLRVLAALVPWAAALGVLPPALGLWVLARLLQSAAQLTRRGKRP